LSLVWLAYRAGSAGTRAALRSDRSRVVHASDGYQGGLLAAALCAGFPVLVHYANHTLSELPSMLCLVAGLTFTAEVVEASWGPDTRNKAIWAGVLVSAGACLRIVNGPLALVAPTWLLLSRRWHPLQAFLAGALAPVLVFGGVDWITWGSFAASYVGYVKFNFLEGKAAIFGVESPSWYVETMFERAPLGLPLMLGLGLVGTHRTWPYLLTASIAVAYLSTQGHKEERFIVLVWPFLLIACAITLGTWLARSTQRRSLVAGHAVAAALCLLILVDGSRHPPGSFFDQERLECQAWVGSQRSARGLMIDNVLLSGGALFFGSRAPLRTYTSSLLDNPLFSHVLTTRGSAAYAESREHGFRVVRRQGSVVVLARR
ncbi:MAG TPA: hypothetical protein VFZ61_02535, partial [Polyangiales bacterium]